jgi:hypothetical protein
MYFNRFDIIEAYYLFGCNYHSGQWSKEYAYTGRCLNMGFRPSPLLDEESLTDNGREIYNSLVERGK